MTDEVTIQELYGEYLGFREEGLNHSQALDEMDYMHSVTRARLEKHIKKNEEVEIETEDFLSNNVEEEWGT